MSVGSCPPTVAELAKSFGFRRFSDNPHNSIYCESTALRDFGFRDQITRSGLSIPSNIAEGMERSPHADQCENLDYARASCAEVRTQTIVGMNVGFKTEDNGKRGCEETRELAAMINGLIRVRTSQPTSHPPTTNSPSYCPLPTLFSRPQLVGGHRFGR